MDISTKRLERLIGWLTFAIGVSSLQRNESIVYRVMQMTAPIPLWAISWIGLGAVMVWLTYTDSIRGRLIVVSLLLLLWGGMLAIVALTGPLGPIGGYGAVICVYLAMLVYKYLRDGHA